MSDWPILNLRDLASKIGSGATPRGGKESYKLIGVPLIRSMNVRFEGFRQYGLAFLDDQQASMLDTAQVRTDDVLLNITGASIGRVTIAPQYMDGARVNQHVCIIRTCDSLAPKFLAHFLASPTQQAQIMAQHVGVTRPGLTKQQICDFGIPIPSRSQQQRIVAEIEKQFSRLDAGVAALRRVAANLKRYKAAVLKAACTGALTADWRAAHPDVEPASKLLDRILKERRRRWEETELAKMIAKGKPPANDKWKAKYKEPISALPDGLGNLPDSWCWLTIDSFAFVTKLAGFEYTKYVTYHADGDLPVIKAENAGREGFRRTDYSRIRSHDIKHLARSCLNGGEVLMVFVGAGVGKVARVPNDQKYFLGPNISMIRVESLLVTSAYLEYFLRSADGHRLALSFAKAVAQPSLSMGTIRQIPVAIPPLNEQARIIEVVDGMMSIAQAAETEVGQNVSRASRLRQSILKGAFEGKLVEQDPTDEPASKLLQRIQAERAKANRKNGKLSPRRRKAVKRGKCK